MARKLLRLPDLPVKHIWDGEARTFIKNIWVTPDNFIATIDEGEAVYSAGDMPVGCTEDMYITGKR